VARPVVYPVRSPHTVSNDAQPETSLIIYDGRVSAPPFPILQTTTNPNDALADALAHAIRGEVRFDSGSRALYATDASNYRQVPIGLVVPRDADDVIAAMAVCRAHNAPVLARGAGTALAGQTCNAAVVFDYTKYMRGLTSLDGDARRAVVEPGIVLDRVREKAEEHKLTFGPDPATHSRCTLGGMIGNNSCGTHGLIGGLTSDNVESLDIVLYDGTRMTVGPTTDEELETIIAAGGRRGSIYAGLKHLRDTCADEIRARYPQIPRRVSGYNLDQLLPENGFHVARALVGSEGTCVSILSATLKLIPSPQQRRLVVLGFADEFAAADLVPRILEWKPIGLEGFDGLLVDFIQRKGLALEDLKLLPEDCRGFLLVEFGMDDAEEVDAYAKRFAEAAKDMDGVRDAKHYAGKEAQRVWTIREQALGATVFVPGEPSSWEGWEDAAVAPEKLGGYLRRLRELLQRHNYRSPMYGHFGQGCVHTRINFDFATEAGVANYMRFIDEAADLVIEYGGSLSGEHGDGQSRGALLPKMFGDRLMHAFHEFKRLWDPGNRMNPGKLVDLDRVNQPDEHLREGPGVRGRDPQTFFSFHGDNGSFASATSRCVGVGACRKDDAGTMCPSYMATGEEKHSTRGRAHLLWELMHSDVLTNGWANEDVKEALDLCLSCKACKTECPVNVDMSVYKAEFLAQYHRHKPHALRDYAFGRMDQWARLAALVPGVTPRLANASLLLPGARPLANALLGLAPQRELPKLAPHPFSTSLQKPRRGSRPASGSGRVQAILWPDTWNNYFHPQVLRSAGRVLVHAGFSVQTPRRHVCCGRPLYDFGMLKEARGYLRGILDRFGKQIDAGLPFVMLEPSCASVFQQELLQFFPHDPRAKRLAAQTHLFADALAKFTPQYVPAKVTDAGALLHGHCHHKALGKLDAERTFLEQACGEVSVPDTGCCGMAGPFGFEQDKYAVSQTLAERRLLPAVRVAHKDALVVTGGFSCREQIRQGAGRKPLHIAEVLAMSL
jgi:FAD/FMN-containing dehydrogenase/Fe-S oxidoreductase